MYFHLYKDIKNCFRNNLIVFIFSIKRIKKNSKIPVLQRGRDSNPRYAFGVYTLSRRAPSTTRPPLYLMNSNK